jgi:hypothetical protein
VTTKFLIYNLCVNNFDSGFKTFVETVAKRFLQKFINMKLKEFAFKLSIVSAKVFGL